MCGVIGIAGENEVFGELYDGLATLQHRGQDAAGMMTFDGNQFHTKRGAGLVRDVILAADISELRGSIGIGHVRYPTAGSYSAEEAQPFFVNSPFGLGLVHNGNLTNTDKLRKELAREGRHLNTPSDSEILLNVFSRELRKQKMTKFSLSKLFAAAKKTVQRAAGSYAAVILVAGYGILAIRDQHGLRPLSVGRRRGKRQDELAAASENPALTALGFENLGDVQPGEAVWLSSSGKIAREQLVPKKWAPCIFEFVYLARPDATIDDISVYRARLRAGEYLAVEIKKSKIQIDVVVPVPDTSRTSALTVASALGVNYREGLIKNRYIGRTFIMSTQAKRQKSIRHKLIPLPLELRNKNVLLVDDSVVRGNTSRQIVEMVRSAGAKKVYFASASPPLRSPCVYGVDMPSKKEFIANKLSISQIAKKLKADGVFYLSLPDLIKSCEFEKTKIPHFCTACFDGKYPTKGIDAKYLAKIEKCRGCSRRKENQGKQQMTLL
ncbi:amidophosphoribosyltransferase [Candidatus Gracilibacteria bacterium]|nr:amidophosphoribosyltransferase [Candidatus Gracilibacteria bacterium]MCF7856152.1 amidophosphoribosyltransferase [Candidatus Gracilibacteria bacterium]MCF7896618.1 amidophosphoribosyltransferase [Candidatus Gracilibacteria bacterium]